MFLTFLWALPALRWRAASPRAPQANGWARLAGPAGNRGQGAHSELKQDPDPHGLCRPTGEPQNRSPVDSAP